MATREARWFRLGASLLTLSSAMAMAACGGSTSGSEVRSATSETQVTDPSMASHSPDETGDAGDGARQRGAAAERLAVKLGALPLAGGVLEGLPPSVAATLKSAVTKLPAAARDELRFNAEQAKRYPMLHLLEGGREPAAWCELATDPRLAFGWFQRAQPEQETPLPLLTQVQGASRVMERAAAYCMRDFALMLKSPGDLAPDRLDTLLQVARLHGGSEITALVFEFLVETEPTRDVWARLALWRARELDVPGARTALETARRGRAGGDGAEMSPWVLAAVEDSVEAAAKLSGERIPWTTRARALLRLGRTGEARSEVSGAGLSPGKHLTSAGILVRAALAESPCSRLDGGAWSSPFCRASWRADPALRAALGTLDQAWAGGEGRDAEAVETYLAVAHVLRESVDGAAVDSRGVSDQSGRVSAAARAAADLSPRLTGIAFYAAVREAIARNSPLAKVEGMGREFGAASGHGLDPAEPFVQAAWLNTAVTYGAGADVSEILAHVPREPRREFVAIAAALRLRNAALHRREDYPDAAAHVVESIAAADDPGLVLLLAETEAVETSEALGRLLILAQRLVEPGNNAALRVRAALDAATALMAVGRWADVEQTLAPFQGADPKALFVWTLARFARGEATRASLNAALVPLKSAANLRSVDWRKWIKAAEDDRARGARGKPADGSPAARTHLVDMSRWASGYRVTSETRLEPEVVFMSHLWPVP